MQDVIGCPVDAVLINEGYPSDDALERYATEHKELLSVGKVPSGCEVISGQFWQGTIARHARRRLSYAVWSVLVNRLLDARA